MCKTTPKGDEKSFEFSSNDTTKIEATNKDNSCMSTTNNNIPLDLKWSQLSKVEKLAGNEHTLVYTAIYNDIPVVVKTINSELENTLAKEDLEQELIMLSKLNHPNVIKLYGAGFNSENGCRFVIIEYCERGSFMGLIGKNKCKKCHIYFRDEFSFKVKDALKHARGIAEGLNYLHEAAIENGMVIHRDLKPDNVGLTKDDEVKLLDFGLAKIVEDASPTSNDVYKMTGRTGTLCYMAPEVGLDKPYNHKVDVYSFGIMLWQLLQAEQPHCCIKNADLFGDLMICNVRPPISKKWPTEVVELMTKCWSANIEERPSFPEIIKTIDQTVALFAKKKKSPFSKPRSMLRRSGFM